MDFICDGNLMVELKKLQRSFDNHVAEREVIDCKMANPQVSDGKKEKIAYRKKIIDTVILPGITNKIRRYSF
jgi:hypothetical protein